MKVLEEYKTIKKIKEGYSLARIGDGEFFNIILRKKDINKLQKFDNQLRDKLLIIFSVPLNNLMIGIPRMDNPKPWVRNFTSEFSKFISNKPANDKTIWSSAFFSRPSLVGKSKQEYFDEVKSIWKDREIVLVNFNRDLLNHDLFMSCSIDFIEITRKNCFNDYHDILKSCKKHFGKNKLFLVSAGPTATCLAYDLTLKGEQVVDIGHIAFEYSLWKNEELEFSVSWYR